MKGKACFILPTYNERENVGSVVRGVFGECKALGVEATVLVVDDEVTYTGVLQEILDSYGLNAVISHRAEHALAILDSLQPRLILLDMMMPEMDGLTVLKKIKTQTPEAVVIIMTAFGSIETAIEAMKAGAYDYVTKPFNLNDISFLLIRALLQFNLSPYLFFIAEKTASILLL